MKGSNKMAGDNIPKPKKNNIFRRFPWGWIFVIIIFYFLVSSVNISMNGVPKEMAYSDFYKILKESPERIKSLTKIEALLQG